MSPNLPPPARVFWGDGEQFYSELADGYVGRWQLNGTVEKIPLDARLVRFVGFNKPAADQQNRLHAQEIEVARNMAAAQERTRADSELRAEKARADSAERRANERVERGQRLLDRERAAVENERRAWGERLDKLLEIAFHIGKVWGRPSHELPDEDTINDADDYGEVTRHPTPQALDTLLDWMAGVIAADHPSVTYPQPSVATIEWAQSTFRDLIGNGYDIVPAMRKLFAQLAERGRAENQETPTPTWMLAEGAAVWARAGVSGRWLPGKVETIRARLDTDRTTVEIVPDLAVGTSLEAHDPTRWTFVLVPDAEWPDGMRPRGPGYPAPGDGLTR